MNGSSANQTLHHNPKGLDTIQVKHFFSSHESLSHLTLAHHFRPILVGVDPIHQLVMFMVVTMHVVLSVGRRGGSFMLSMLQYVVQLSLTYSEFGRKLSQREQRLLADFPRDLRTAESTFQLEGKRLIYAVCPNPSCHRTYQPTFEDGSPIPNYPSTCSYRQFSGGKRCKEQLLRSRIVGGKEIMVPIKPFLSFDFKDWVSRLLSRPGFEERMDASWTDASVPPSDYHKMQDIFDGQILREFKGLDGKHFSLGGNEGRYVFSLCVDFFNPLMNKQAGKKSSIGIISLVCLNLGPELRYKPENMFLAGIIPGPNEPPLTALNHYLTPLVSELLEFWHPGVQFSRTHKFPGGRLVRCALICVVCDLPAARKTGGFAASSHNHFCAICHCTRKKQGYNNLNYGSWERRTNDDCRQAAELYMSASDSKERDRILGETGVRWSELLRLPYFDPSRFIVVDAMHNLFLGLIQEHFQGILGIRLDKDPDVEAPVLELVISNNWSTFPASVQKSVIKLLKWLQSPMADELRSDAGKAIWISKFMKLHLSALEFMCAELNCPTLPRDPAKPNQTTRMLKIDWIARLLSWVCFPTL